MLTFSQNFKILNAEKALEIWGEPSVYCNWLNKFCESYSVDCCEIEWQSIETLPKFLHRLKGASASMGNNGDSRGDQSNLRSAAKSTQGFISPIPSSSDAGSSNFSRSPSESIEGSEIGPSDTSVDPDELLFTPRSMLSMS